jgi:hypothetical protein
VPAFICFALLPQAAYLLTHRYAHAKSPYGHGYQHHANQPTKNGEEEERAGPVDVS